MMPLLVRFNETKLVRIFDIQQVQLNSIH